MLTTLAICCGAGAGGSTSGTGAGPESAREATCVGAVGLVLLARSVAGARGMASDCPARSFDFSDSALASARSVRLTLSLRAMVAMSRPS